MTTIHDVAKLAGVSIGTVSNVLNQSNKVAPATMERVQSAIAQLNYIPNTAAKSLKTNQSRILGIIAEDVSAFSSGEIINGICKYCETHDYAVNLCNLRVNDKVNSATMWSYGKLAESDSFIANVQRAITILLTSRVDGIIYIGVHPRDVGNILPQLDIPIVYTYAHTQREDYCVNYDDYQGAQLAVEHLIQNGHTKIALICGSIDSFSSHRRLMGYQNTLMENNLVYHPEYVRSGNWNYEGGYQSCLDLLNLSDPPTAIFSMSDLMAYGAINAALSRGLSLPGQLSIHGFDDLALSPYITPSLSTVGLPLREMGTTSASIMLQLLNNTFPEQRNVLLPCSHVVRLSVTCPDQSGNIN